MQRRMMPGIWLLALAQALSVPRPGWCQQVPRDSPFQALEVSLHRYRAMAEGKAWPRLPQGQALTPGTRDARVKVLRARLAIEGYAVPDSAADPEVYDSALAAAVLRFQALHGLEQDAVVGRATLEAMNVSAAVRVKQIVANLERHRLPTDSLGDRYIRVNIAAFMLEVIDGGRVAHRHPVVVGRPSWRTPAVRTQTAELIFSPRWTVPRSIAVAEVLPLARRDAGYLRRIGMRVFRDGREVDPGSLDWSGMTARSFRYQLVQDPGPTNPLGGVKIVLQSRFGVHLHDTPARRLFERRVRALSHGCVRVDRVEGLVAYLLPEWPADSIRVAMAAGQERSVRLPAPIPVQLVYWTAWSEGGGPLAFRPDVYRLDRR